MTVPTPEVVLDFWFGHGADAAAVARVQAGLWWGKAPATDARIRAEFGALREAAIAGRLAEWEHTPRGRLALIVLVDQLSRNIHRGAPEAFAHDALARRWATEGLPAGVDGQLRPIERVFFYLPLQHSENTADQDRAVGLYRELVRTAAAEARETFESFLEFAERHREIIRRFGRFPHRNEILGRASTPEEKEFLRQPGSAF